MNSYRFTLRIIVVIFCSSVYFPKTDAFLSQSQHMTRFSSGIVRCRSRIGNRAKEYDREIPSHTMPGILNGADDNNIWDGANDDGNGDDSGWRGGGGGGSGGRSGGGGGDGDNGGDGHFGGNYGNLILGSLPIALSKKYKEDAKRKVVSIITKLPSSQLVLSPALSNPIASSEKMVMNLPNISIQYIQHVTKMSLANTKSRTSDILKWYINELDTNPLIVKSITSGVVSICADFAAQMFEQSKCSLQGRKVKNYDQRRLIASVVEGVFISGPLMHFGYSCFENLIPIHGSNSSQNIAAIAHVLADSIILDSVFVATKIFTTGVLEGHSIIEDIVPQLQNDYIDTMKTSFVTSTGLLPLEFACFRLLPISLRPLSMDMTSVVWDGVISYKAHEARRHCCATKDNQPRMQIDSTK